MVGSDGLGRTFLEGGTEGTVLGGAIFRDDPVLNSGPRGTRALLKGLDGLLDED